LEFLQVGEGDGGLAGVAGASVLVSLDAVGVVTGSFDDAWVTTLSAGWVEVLGAGDVGGDAVDGVLELLRGKKPPGRR
jgi:hypothetical protein